MPGSISVPNSGSFENNKNTGSQMGQANKKYLDNIKWSKTLVCFTIMKKIHFSVCEMVAFWNIGKQLFFVT